MTAANSMTVAQLRAFLAAARTRSFTAAAAELGLAQASISELVRRLEQEYGLVLFLRGRRRLVLTSAGELLLPAAERAISGFDSADAGLRAFGGLHGGIATFGLMRNAEYYLLSDLAETFHSRYPDVNIRLVGQNSSKVAAAVAAGDLEAAIVILPVDVDDLDVRVLLEDEVVIATTNPSRYGRTATVVELAAAPLVLYDAHFGRNDPTRRQLYDRAVAEGVRIDPIIEVEDVAPALRLAARGVGDTVVARAITQSPIFPTDLRLVPFENPIHDVIASVTRDAGALSPASREMLLLAEEMIRGGTRR